MSQRLTTPWISTNVPGAYINTTVISTASGLATSGVIVLIGEAAGGPSYSQVKLANNFFGPQQLNNVKAMYTSGPLVDAFQGLAAPSNDPDITGSASSVYLVKTNTGSKATGAVDTDYGTLSDKNYGVGGNQYKHTETALDSEVAPAVTGTTIPAFGAPLNGDTFHIRLNGGASTAVTLSGTAGDHDTIGHLVTELNALLPSGIVASAGTAPNNLILTMSVDATANRKGWGKSFELIDSTPGDLAALGLIQGLTVSSQEPAIEVQIVRADTGTNELHDVNASVAMSMGYAGTTATVTINATTLSTTVTGGSGANLSIPLSQYTTVKDLSAFINSQPGYSSSNASSANQLPPSALDQVSAVGICATEASTQPGRIKDGAYNFQAEMATSATLDFTPTAVAGIPSPGVAAYLSGGELGGTLAADVAAAIALLSGIQCNIIVPLFSQDASADIAAGNTDSSSTYTISAIHQLIKTHCIQFSTPTLKKNRMAILSFNGTYLAAKTEAQSVGTYRCAMTCQQATQVNSQGVTTQFLPWFAAVNAAGMQAGGFYKSVVNHYANIVSFSDPAGYDSGDPFDVSDALTAGLLVLTQDIGGVKWVSDSTTYGLDQNFVYNSVQAVYLSDILALDIAQSFQQAMVGKSLADISASSALSFLQQLFDKYKKLKMTTTSNDAPLGYKNASIQIAAPSMFVAVEAKLTTSLYFIAIDLALSAVQQSA